MSNPELPQEPDWRTVTRPERRGMLARRWRTYFPTFSDVSCAYQSEDEEDDVTNDEHKEDKVANDASEINEGEKGNQEDEADEEEMEEDEEDDEEIDESRAEDD